MPSKTATVKKPAKAAPKAAAKTTKTKAAAKPVAKSVKAPAKAPAKAVKKPVTKAAVKPVAKAAPKAVKKPIAKVVAKPVAKNVAKAAPVKQIKTAANTSVKPAKVTKIVKAEPEVKATAKAVVAAPAKAPKNDNVAYEYKAGDKVVYPAHGVGCVEGIEKLTVAGTEVTLYTITFVKDRMRLKLPLQKVQTSGLRRLATEDQLAEIFQTMKGRARIRRVMWSRRAQEYEAKINSGSPVQVAEVLRDLRRNVSSTEHSYSERQIFQQALERLASEIAAIDNIAEDQAAQKLQNILADAA